MHPQKNSLYDCKAPVYASKVGGKLTIKILNSGHSHALLASGEIRIQLSSTRKSIPENIKEEAYRLPQSGEPGKDIYNLIKKNHYPNNNIPFTFDPLKNYLYNRNKKESISYQDITEIYGRLKEEQGITKSLAMKTFGEESNLKALAFTFHEQINYGKFFLSNNPPPLSFRIFAPNSSFLSFLFSSNNFS